MDNEQSYNFYNNKQGAKSGSLSSIASARAQRQDDIQQFNKGNKESEYLKALDEQIEKLEKIGNLTTKQKNMLSEAKAVQVQINKFTSITNQNYDEFLKKNEEVVKLTQQLSKEIYNTNYSKNIDNEKELARLIRQRARDQETYNDLIDDLNKKLEANKEGSKSQLDAFTEGLHSFRDEIGKLAVIKGVGDITQGLFDKNSSINMNNVYKNTSAQLGITSSEFNSFKNSLSSQLMKSDNFFNFGWKDTADYLNRLGDLNITSQEMAEEQYLAVIQGTKYLGLQTETQAKVLKIAKDTGRMDLLQTTNETMVQIMNAQLGVSKDQLNQMVSQAADLADLSVFLGGDGSALAQLEKIQAAVTSEYGKSTSDAAMNILTEIMNNPASNKYLTNGFLGGNYNQIVHLAQNGQMDEAIKNIITSIQSSQSTQVARDNVYAANALGADNNIMAIANSSGSMENVNKNMADINNSSSDIAATIKEFNQDWSDKIINAGSTILSMLPFSQVLTLQNAYYALATVELVFKIPKLLASAVGLLTQIAKSSAIGASGLDGKSPLSLQGLLSNKLITTVGSIAAVVGGIAIGVNDAKEAISNSEKWGTGKTASAIGGFLGGSDDEAGTRILKKVAQYGLIGAGIGTLIAPGIGSIVGGVLGIIAGVALGAVGGEAIAQDVDSVFGRRKDLSTDSGGGAAPNMITPHIPSTGGKGATTSSYPWTITSKFGTRTLSNGDSSFHNGVDWGIPTGTPIGAPVSGTISSAKTDNRNTWPNGPSSAGSGIYLQGDDGVTYQFWHLSSVGVKTGQRVNAGEAIGLSGNTGYSTGPHLHFGTKVAGNWQNPLNYVTSGLFEANGDSYVDSSSLALSDSESKEGEKLLQTVISADTLSNQAGAYGMGAGNDDVVFAVNNGFAGLNAKLEELSSRQDNQEEALRQLTSSKASNIARY